MAPRHLYSSLHPSSHSPSFTRPQSRREFLRTSALLAGAGIATPFAAQLAGLGAASVSAASPRYRALVCIFMFGGNDSWNSYVPFDDASYATYAAARAGLAIPHDQLLPMVPDGGFPTGRRLAFAPTLSKLRGLFDAGDVALISNVGTMTGPIDKATYRSSPQLRPPQLFSHNDQQSVWQSSSPEGAKSGWAGRMADLLLEWNASNTAYTCISPAGNAVMLVGRQATPFAVTSSGVVVPDFSWAPAPMAAGVGAMMRRSGADVFSSSYGTVTKRSLALSQQVTDAIAAATKATTVFSSTGLGRQLRVVADLIAAGRQQLGLKRQIFFVSTGGFDTHSGLTTTHPVLMQGIDSAMAEFHAALTQLGAIDDVTTFTASDFGRTLASNGDGSDHGWGGHHVVMGGSVRGRRVFGATPVVALDGVDDVGSGRLLPTTAVDQYAATLARWMGVRAGDLPTVVPNIGRFASSDLGFMESDESLVDVSAGNGKPATRLGPRG